MLDTGIEYSKMGTNIHNEEQSGWPSVLNE
jgi:hypothetical protein